MTRPSAFLAAAALLLAGCGGAEPSPAAPSAQATGTDDVFEPCPEQPADAAAGEATLPPLAFDCLGGGTLDLARAPGTPTVVNLWGSWCAPCREELPLLQDFADAAGEQVQVVGVISRDGRPQAGSFAADSGVRFPGAFDGEGALMAELGINALPYTYFLTADGALAHTEAGPVESVGELRDLVAEHLGVRL